MQWLCSPPVFPFSQGSARLHVCARRQMTPGSGTGLLVDHPWTLPAYARFTPLLSLYSTYPIWSHTVLSTPTACCLVLRNPTTVNIRQHYKFKVPRVKLQTYSTFCLLSLRDSLLFLTETSSGFWTFWGTLPLPHSHLIPVSLFLSCQWFLALTLQWT